jgi:hypothetical protein
MRAELKTRLKDLIKTTYSVGPMAENQHFNAVTQVYEDQEKKLLKYALRLDIYYLVKHLLKYHTKESMVIILKKHYEALQAPLHQEKSHHATTG